MPSKLPSETGHSRLMSFRTRGRGVLPIAALIAVAGFGLQTSTPAHADLISYDWSFVDVAIGNPPNTGSGQLTIDSGQQATNSNGTGYLIVSMTGTVDGNAISLLPPSPNPSPNLANDNLLYPANPPGMEFDGDGLAFFVAPDKFFPSGYNMFLFCGFGHCFDENTDSFFSAELVNDTFALSPGPIAGAGIPSLIAACAGVLVWWRRRRKTV
jgi:hypothetical protein